MDPIDFGGQRSKVKVTMDIYGNNLVNTIATKPLCISSSNVAEMLTVLRRWTLLILEFRGQRSRSQWTLREISCEPNTDSTFVCFLIKLGRHVNHVKPYWFWRPQFKGEWHDGYHWQMWGARGCYALRCYIFTVLQINFECRPFASIFVGVMPLLELRILEIHSIPHFSLTPFNILSWNFA